MRAASRIALLVLGLATATPGEPSPATLSEDECREALTPERLDLYRRTTWGRTCRAWRTTGLAPDPATELLNTFCDAIE